MRGAGISDRIADIIEEAFDDVSLETRSLTDWRTYAGNAMTELQSAIGSYDQGKELPRRRDI